MGKNTKLVATVIPVKYDKDKKLLHISINLTPRLPDSGALNEYPELLNWPEYYKAFQEYSSFSFWPIDNNDRPTVVTPVTLKGKLTKTLLPRAQGLWENMFFPDTIVSGWIINELPYELSDRITQNRLREGIRKAIDETIESLVVSGNFGDPDDPYRTDGRDDQRRSAMSSFILHLRRLKQEPVATILADPLLTNATFQPHLSNLMLELNRLKSESKRQFDDLLVRLTVSEIEKRNYEETNEFHKRFAAYANHPFLLEETGWILHYTIDLSEHEAIVLQRGFIQLSSQEATEALQIDQITRRMQPTHFSILKPPDSASPDDELIAAFKQEISFLTPLTCIHIAERSGGNINYRALLTGKYNTADGDATLLNVDAINGYIEVENPNYHVTANLVDKNQLLARIEAILQTNFENVNEATLAVERRNRLDVIANENLSINEELAGGSTRTEYISNGIAVDIKQLKEIINTQLQISPETILELKRRDTEDMVRDQLKGSGIIYQHNLFAGYRVDTITIKGNKCDTFIYGSLCQKDEYFFLMEKKRFVECPQGEGWLVESTQASNSGRLYVDEELFRWNDWSLTAAQYGDHNPNEEKVFCNKKLHICAWPGSNTMVPLRFGRRYSFALRPTDIIGHGQGPVDVNKQFSDDSLVAYLQTFGNDPDAQSQRTVNGDPAECAKFWTKPVLYQRVDAINTPIVFLGHRLLRKADNSELYNPDGNSKDEEANVSKPPLPDWLDHRWGEDINTMVIRSYVKNHKLEYDPDTASRRYIGPPRANLNFVIQHGSLDKYFERITSITDEKVIEKHRNELLDVADVEINTDVQYVLREQRADEEKIFYLYDPIVKGFEFIADNIVRRVDRAMSSFGHEEYWKNHRFIRFDLDNDSSFSFPQQNSLWRIGLSQGAEKDITISCMSDDRMEAEAGPLQDFFLKGVAKIRRANLKVVHAVQKPCLLNNSYPAANNFLEEIGEKLNVLFAKRVPNSTDVLLDIFTPLLPVLTSDGYFLHMESYSFIPDRAGTEKGYRIERIRKIAKNGFYPADGNNETNVSFNELLHSFDNTHYRKVNYRLECVSRFRKYFPPKLADVGFSVFTNAKTWVSDNDSTEKTDAEYLANAAGWLDVPSSRMPDTPVIDRIVPLMKWELSDDNKTITRICNTIRIYFDGDWYSSGPGEQLAVLFIEDNDKKFDSDNTLYFDKTPADPTFEKDISIDNAISQLGKDPAAGKIIFNSNKIVKIKKDLFDDKCIPGWMEPVTVPLSALETDKPKNSILDNLIITAALFNIDYRKNSAPTSTITAASGVQNQKPMGQFFVDIPFKKEKLEEYYFPFVRLALARYQPHSIDDPEGKRSFHFSKVVITDFVQLLPQRQVTIKGTTVEYNYHKSSIRQRGSDAGEPTNKLYLLKEKLSEKSSVFECGEDPDPTVKTVDAGGKISFPIPATSVNEQLIIAEYEDYADTADIVPDEKDPRKDFTKRLIFSYIINSTDPTRIANAKYEKN